MKFYLFYWILGSCIVASGLFFYIGNKVNKLAMLICISTTFSLLLVIEVFATKMGIWSWSDRITLLMIGKIPLEEIIIYVTSAMLTILFFEIFHHMITHYTQKTPKRNKNPKFRPQS